MRRDWTKAREKVEDEGRCRVCKKSGELDAAHVIPRSASGGVENMEPAGVIPLCRLCHNRQHTAKLDILPYLTLEEQAHAASLVGIASAYRHTTGDRL
jgi:5-methylcytosine-specific restriction endonuclease McrA